MGIEKNAVQDGANIAYEVRTKKGQARITNLLSVRDALQELSYETITNVDANLINEFDDSKQMEAMLDRQEIQAPAGTAADYLILETADREEAFLISNDLFQPYQDQYPCIEDRRVPYLIINGDVQLYTPYLGKMIEGRLEGGDCFLLDIYREEGKCSTNPTLLEKTTGGSILT